jgi:hypothetical protein
VAVRGKSVPCRRDVFERLLSSSGFAARDKLVRELMLRSDYRRLRSPDERSVIANGTS